LTLVYILVPYLICNSRNDPQTTSNSSSHGWGIHLIASSSYSLKRAHHPFQNTGSKPTIFHGSYLRPKNLRSRKNPLYYDVPIIMHHLRHGPIFHYLRLLVSWWASDLSYVRKKSFSFKRNASAGGEGDSGRGLCERILIQPVISGRNSHWKWKSHSWRLFSVSISNTTEYFRSCITWTRQSQWPRHRRLLAMWQNSAFSFILVAKLVISHSCVDRDQSLSQGISMYFEMLDLDASFACLFTLSFVKLQSSKRNQLEINDYQLFIITVQLVGGGLCQDWKSIFKIEVLPCWC
jgi:hypothetical protein